MNDDDVRVALESILQKSQSLDEAIAAAGSTASTVDKHWGMMQKYASQCESVVEYGTGFSTLAWLGACKSVLSVDVILPSWIGRLRELAGDRLVFTQASSLEHEPVPCDLLYIDTFHVYSHAVEELFRHGPHARKYILMHDTWAFGFQDSELIAKYHPGDKGLWRAITEFLCVHQEWIVEETHDCQFGMTALKRRD